MTARLSGRALRGLWCAGVIVALVGVVEAAQLDVQALKDPSRFTEEAPATYRARFDTSKGVFVIEVHRDWAPLAADRFYNLVKGGFYDDTRFFRVVEGFVAQFGMSGDPVVQAAWNRARLQDEPVVQSNTRGFVTFTKESMPSTRYTMVFINLADNSRLDQSGFPPFGQVVSGMEVVDSLYSGYGDDKGPDQRRMLRQGNAYLQESFPELDYVRTAVVE
jgi:peptidyl-prolyl cis-trans isomerase A (cyclophilin A)